MNYTSERMSLESIVNVQRKETNDCVLTNPPINKDARVMFYFKPPRGDILLNDLYDCVSTRVNYFLNKYQNDVSIPIDALNFEHLILGTALDRTGHFTLRLLSTRSTQLEEFISTSEAAFMLERLQFLSSKQITDMLKTTLRHINELDLRTIEDAWILEIKNVCISIRSAFKSKHIHDFSHSEHCKELKIKVPFQMCLALVAKRQLEMDKGSVVVPCGKWKLFMEALLKSHFKREMSRLAAAQDQSKPFTDVRLEELEKVIISTVLKHTVNHKSKDCIDANEIEIYSKLFPPCMASLYNNLKNKHRLGHNGRFNFSLFLKDIGVPLNESLRFWRDEYSKPSKCGWKCSHSWQKDSKKYTYSVRHLYGLEGKRAQYCSASCSKIQNTELGPIEEGGCPFKTFDNNRLKSILNPQFVKNTEELNKVLDLRMNNQASLACIHYRKSISKLIYEEIDANQVKHSSPVEYFVALK